jgi:integrase
MAMIRRGKIWHLRIRPFGDQIWVSTGANLKSVADNIEKQIMVACRSQDYSLLDPQARSACLAMFRNQAWEIPSSLAGKEPVKEELTLWKAIELCLKYPEVRDNPNRERHEQAFVHLIEKWGKDFPVKSIWIPQIKEYQMDRLNQGTAASTIGKERAALSKMFQVLIELGHVDQNPVRLVKGPSDRDGRREVYISFDDFNKIVAELPCWVKPIVHTLYFTGMRRGEVLGLGWENLNLDSRIIRLHAHQTKERQQKRIPIHRVLVPVLESVRKVRSIATDRVFLIDGGKPPCEDSLRKPWKAAVEAVGFDPAPTIHDLRHVWKTNAMRSRIDYEIREAILGHGRGIAGRYGRISDEDLVRSVNGMTFDKGETEIWLARREKENPEGATSGLVKKMSAKCEHSNRGSLSSLR